MAKANKTFDVVGTPAAGAITTYIYYRHGSRLWYSFNSSSSNYSLFIYYLIIILPH